ncbi:MULTISPECIES: AfsR/SARP family transcriptional regulator [unclassified Streptomyces]|uniref:AfsR/SARP family transcriptional regulator n=1 Tax=unclassified Streptomyces TaxID=2593676 RepID=UPI001BE94043|nr:MULTISPECIES: AfsR/SARP family transcriptional regulator [unclassified Streptomyces]MBT2405489.1 AfsR/SARP family transcriptional regulator [Streptomyces sp. ISL-21]MBT2454407.1 AfsR/SARP family transcriptional regulator [Streptomyces sp. ISL-86]MBT2607832.1 AfsR/SARP family transcriptional regulator [Streptomyces sp. ISL-87]
MASKRVTSLLTFLALSPRRTVSADQIEDELWGHQRMTNARNALQANVVRLRKYLESLTGVKGTELIRTVGSGYLLDLSPERVDAHRFLRQAEAGAALVHHDPARAITELEQALFLWRGPALMDAVDGVRIRQAAAHLEERRITAYEDLITAMLAVEAHRIPVPELRQIASDHPERERLSELLMVTLYRAGRQAEALEVFHGARRRLAGDLGLEPGRALNRAYQAILEQDDALGEPRQALAYAGPRG